jgi:hypothetical protein
MGSERFERGVKLTPAQRAASEVLRKGVGVASVLALGGETVAVRAPCSQTSTPNWGEARLRFPTS